MEGRLRRILPTLIVGMGVLAGCSSDEPPQPSKRQAQLYMQGLDGQGVIIRPGTDVNVLYGEAITLKEKGDCAGAIKKLQPIANIGPGYENAQTALGECLLRQASSSELSADYLEGLTWLRRAADGGWPEAQFRLAEAHSLGTQVIRNTDEAGYWLAVYQNNAEKARVGFTPPSARDMTAVLAAIPDASKATGVMRAATWQRHAWIPSNPTSGPGPTGAGVQRGPGLPTNNGMGR